MMVQLELLLNGVAPGAATAAEWQVAEFTCVPPEGWRLELLANGLALEPFLRPGEPAWCWRWNPQNAVGRWQILLRAFGPGGELVTQSAMVEVAPRKIDRERYTALLEDIEALSAALLYTLAGAGVGAVATAPASGGQSPAVLALMGERFDALERAVERIVRHPHSSLRPTAVRVGAGEVRNTGRILTSDLAAFASEGELTELRSAASADTYENRLLKRLLSEIIAQSRAVAAFAGRSGPRASLASTQAQAVAGRAARLRSLPLFEEVAGGPGTPPEPFRGPTRLLRRDPDYRTVYHFWRDLHRLPGVAFDNPLLTIPIQELPRLYEVWCALQVVAALVALPGLELISQALIVARPGGIFLLDLCEHEPLIEARLGEDRWRLRYQPRYRPDPRGHHLGSLDHHTRVPDLALEIGAEPPAVVVFDAKYRLEAGGGVPEAALADAYSYLGGIGDARGIRATRTALLLYPGTGSAEQYASGVGIVPLLPGETDVLKTILGPICRS